MDNILCQLPALLIPWFREHRRDLPWRRDRAPYHVWLSEIMLQQTRVEAVKGYYLRFLAALPTIEALAEAEEAELLKLWEGLGYYSRVRNLQKAARVIQAQYSGAFPSEYGAIRALPGIGDYTAGAIASICFDLPTPAVDGNVLRVVSRVLDDHGCTDDPKVRRRFRDRLAEVYPPEDPGTFTQALMELGATVCVPNGAPDCENCPMSELCKAKQAGTIPLLPVRAPKRSRKKQHLTVLLLTCGDRLAVRRRPETGLLAGLWELPNLEKALTPQRAVRLCEDWGLRPEALEKSVTRQHIFTHIQWDMTGIRIRCGAEGGGFTWADREAVRDKVALPTAFRQFLPDVWEDFL